MSSRNWKFRVQDILDCIAKIQAYIDDIDLEDFSTNTMVIDAVIRNFEIIGEASNHIPEKVKQLYPNVP